MANLPQRTDNLARVRQMCITAREIIFLEITRYCRERERERERENVVRSTILTNDSLLTIFMNWSKNQRSASGNLYISVRRVFCTFSVISLGGGIKSMAVRMVDFPMIFAGEIIIRTWRYLTDEISIRCHYLGKRKTKHKNPHSTT